MARKRMFDLEIINQDSFLDLPMESKALYFLLGMEADDEGFVAPRKVLRLYGGTEDSLKVLILKEFIIPFSSGVIVITDWKRNNYLDKNKVKDTIYQEEKKQLTYNEETEKYESLTKVKQKLNQYSIVENSIEYNIKEKNIKKRKFGEFNNVLLTDEEYRKLENANLLTYIEKLSSYIASKGKKYKSHYATILNWSRKEKKDVPNWLDKEFEENVATEDEIKKLEEKMKKRYTNN